MTHLLGVLFKEAELEALVELELPDVPHLMEMLPRGVELIQQTGHLAKSESSPHINIWSFLPGPVLFSRGLIVDNSWFSKS